MVMVGLQLELELELWFGFGFRLGLEVLKHDNLHCHLAIILNQKLYITPSPPTMSIYILHKI